MSVATLSVDFLRSHESVEWSHECSNDFNVGMHIKGLQILYDFRPTSPGNWHVAKALTRVWNTLALASLWVRGPKSKHASGFMLQMFGLVRTAVRHLRHQDTENTSSAFANTGNLHYSIWSYSAVPREGKRSECFGSRPCSRQYSSRCHSENLVTWTQNTTVAMPKRMLRVQNHGSESTPTRLRTVEMSMMIITGRNQRRMR